MKVLAQIGVTGQTRENRLTLLSRERPEGSQENLCRCLRWAHEYFSLLRPQRIIPPTPAFVKCCRFGNVEYLALQRHFVRGGCGDPPREMPKRRCRVSPTTLCCAVRAREPRGGHPARPTSARKVEDRQGETRAAESQDRGTQEEIRNCFKTRRAGRRSMASSQRWARGP